MSNYNKNNPVHQIRIAALMLFILASSILFLLSSPAPQPLRVVVPDLVSVTTLDEALNLSLAYGDYRRVNVDWNGVA